VERKPAFWWHERTKKEKNTKIFDSLIRKKRRLLHFRTSALLHFCASALRARTHACTRFESLLRSRGEPPASPSKKVEKSEKDTKEISEFSLCQQ
jgi:hypothetical protein